MNINASPHTQSPSISIWRELWLSEARIPNVSNLEASMHMHMFTDYRRLQPNPPDHRGVREFISYLPVTPSYCTELKGAAIRVPPPSQYQEVNEQQKLTLSFIRIVAKYLVAAICKTMQDLNEYESVSGAAELAGVSDESLDLLSDNQRPSDTANQRDLSSNDKENKEPDESKKDIQSQSDNGTEESSPGQEELARKEDSAAGTPGRIQLPTESPHQVDSEHLVQIATDAGKARAISTRKWRFLLSKMGLAVYGSRDVLVRRLVAVKARGSGSPRSLI